MPNRVIKISKKTSQIMGDMVKSTRSKKVFKKRLFFYYLTSIKETVVGNEKSYITQSTSK